MEFFDEYRVRLLLIFKEIVKIRLKLVMSMGLWTSEA